MTEPLSPDALAQIDRLHDENGPGEPLHSAPMEGEYSALYRVLYADDAHCNTRKDFSFRQTQCTDQDSARFVSNVASEREREATVFFQRVAGMTTRSNQSASYPSDRELFTVRDVRGRGTDAD